jgi:hypothetical protein
MGFVRLESLTAISDETGLGVLSYHQQHEQHALHQAAMLFT